MYLKDPLIASSLVQVIELLIKFTFVELSVSSELNNKLDSTTLVIVLAAAFELSEVLDRYVIVSVVFCGETPKLLLDNNFDGSNDMSG